MERAESLRSGRGWPGMSDAGEIGRHIEHGLTPQ